MSRNLTYQFKNAIDLSFDAGGIDKHSAKKDGAKPGDHVYSYSQRSNLIKTSHQLGDYIKDNYPEVKFVKDIKSNMVQSFLNSKADNCSNSTLGQYRSRVNTLEAIIKNIYHVRANFTKDLITPMAISKVEKIRNIAMDSQDLKKILHRAEAMDSRSKAPVAIELAARFGLRVSETCKLQPRDIHFQEMKLAIIDSKGKRTRTISFMKCDVPFLRKIIKGKDEKERICNIKEDSVNKYLERAEETLHIREKYKNAVTGIHCIRKMAAQRLFDGFRDQGLSRKEALGETSIYLGHGKNRNELMRQYVLYIH